MTELSSYNFGRKRWYLADTQGSAPCVAGASGEM